MGLVENHFGHFKKMLLTSLSSGHQQSCKSRYDFLPLNSNVADLRRSQGKRKYVATGKLNYWYLDLVRVVMVYHIINYGKFVPHCIQKMWLLVAFEISVSN